MQTAASINLVLTDSSSLKRFADLSRETSYGGFYQQLASELVKGAYTQQVVRTLGERLVIIAEQLHAFRQMDALEQVSRILVSMPLPRQFDAIGRYYQALCIHNFGRGDVERAAKMLESVAGSAPPRYRAKALISLGANSYRKRDNQSALSLYRDADRFISRSGLYDPYATIHTQRMFAVIKSEDGNHRDAVSLLESLFPLGHTLRSSQPHVYYDFMNSLAVELCEVGRLEEAKNASQIVLASPFASAYPEWRATRDEIELKGWRAPRSVIAVGQISAHLTHENILRMPIGAHSASVAQPFRAREHAPVLDMQAWKKKMTKEDEKPPRPATSEEKQARLKELKKLEPGEVIIKIMDNIGDERVTDARLLKALIVLEELESLEDEG